VIALGGFSGSDPSLTLARLKTLIREGQVTHFLLSGGAFGRGGGTNALLTRLVANTSPVSAGVYGGLAEGRHSVVSGAQCGAADDGAWV
jgi:hypothetical protein